MFIILRIFPVLVFPFVLPSMLRSLLFLMCQCVSYRQHTAPPSYSHGLRSFLFFFLCVPRATLSPYIRLAPFYHIGKVFPLRRCLLFFLPTLLLLLYKLPTKPCSNSIMLPTKRRAACIVLFMLRATHYARSQLRPLWWLRVPVFYFFDS